MCHRNHYKAPPPTKDWSISCIIAPSLSIELPLPAEWPNLARHAPAPLATVAFATVPLHLSAKSKQQTTGPSPASVNQTFMVGPADILLRFDASRAATRFLTLQAPEFWLSRALRGKSPRLPCPPALVQSACRVPRAGPLPPAPSRCQ